MDTFIHNKINVSLEKEKYYLEFVNDYVNLYKPKAIVFRRIKTKRTNYLCLCDQWFVIIFSL